VLEREERGQKTELSFGHLSSAISGGPGDNEFLPFFAKEKP